MTRTERRAEKEADMPPEVFAERMARVDGCPNACENYEPPRWVEDAPEGFRAGYRCGVCRESWVTAWGDA